MKSREEPTRKRPRAERKVPKVMREVLLRLMRRKSVREEPPMIERT